MRRHSVFLFLSVLLAACMPLAQNAGPRTIAPKLFEDRIRMADGVELPLARFFPETAPKAVLLALHGFNDYRNAFADPSEILKTKGVAIYAYDQRGFGAAPQRGIWPGEETLVQDLRTAAALVRAAHPKTPLYLLGHSMGGAVVLAAMADAPLGAAPLAVDGVVLAAPAVRARKTMFFLKPALLWVAAHTIPWAKFSGRDLEIRPSDNVAMLKKLGKDPLVLKESRVDAVWGLLNLMDRGFAAAGRIKTPALFLFGAQDELIPKDASEAMLATLPRPRPESVRVAIYEKGYHMLLRDLQAETVLKDVAAWIADREAALPSGAEAVAASPAGEKKLRVGPFAATPPLE